MYNDGLLPRLRRDRFTLLLGACAVTGALLVLARGLNFGVALYTAGIHISVARSLLAGDGFMQIIHGPMVNWPPLYPLLLAAATFFTFDPHAVAGPVNAVIFALTVLLVGLWLRQRLASRFLALWACLATMLAFPLVREASWASTEPLFILMSVLSLMHLDKFIREGREPSLLWAAAFAALACLTRYMGIALAAASVLLLASQPGGGGLRKARRIALYSLIALTPVCLWMTRNFVLVGHITGKQFSVNYSISPAGIFAWRSRHPSHMAAPRMDCKASFTCRRGVTACHLLGTGANDGLPHHPRSTQLAWVHRIRHLCPNLPSRPRSGNNQPHLGLRPIKIPNAGLCTLAVNGHLCRGQLSKALASQRMASGSSAHSKVRLACRTLPLDRLQRRAAGWTDSPSVERRPRSQPKQLQMGQLQDHSIHPRCARRHHTQQRGVSIVHSQ